MISKDILLIEDEQGIADFISQSLAKEGYHVEVALDGATGLYKAHHRDFDFIILDLMLPDIEGLDICRQLREMSEVPILILTAREAVAHRVAGLDAGADDYLVKPFALDELLARMRALFRRRQPREAGPLRFSDLELDTVSRRVRRGEREIELTPKEYDLLELFLLHPDQVLTREIIYDRVWGYDFGGESNIIEVYIRYLRSKLEEGGEPRLLQTVRGVGYVLREGG